jgi:hypothetical protein
MDDYKQEMQSEINISASKHVTELNVNSVSMLGNKA